MGEPHVVFIGGYDINLDDISFVQRLRPAPRERRKNPGEPFVQESVPVVIDQEDMDTKCTMIMIAFKGSGQFGLPPFKGKAMEKFLHAWELHSWNGRARNSGT